MANTVLISSSITGAVTDQIDQSWDLVTTAFNQGLAALDNLGNQAYEFLWNPVELETIELPGLNLNEPSIPAADRISLRSVGFQGQAVEHNTVDIPSVDIPEYVDSNYNFNIPGAPAVNWPSFYKNAPGVSTITVPSIPTFNIPEIPALENVTIPAPPEYSVEEFEGVMPVDDLTVPALSFNWGESEYSSGLKTKLGDTLYDSLVAGGSGLDEETEQAIYDRAKSRQEEENQLLFDTISNQMEEKGFPLPHGHLSSAILEAENKILRSREDLNKDILVQQSDLAQKNTHFVISEAVKLEGVLIGYHNEVQRRSQDSAKFVVTTAQQLYMLRLESYKAKLQAYSVLAQVYQTRIQGEIAKAEFYRSQIEGVKASVDVQRSLIDAYRAQIAGIAALVDVYRTQMEGANIQAGIDKTKMEGFLAEVQAYATRIQGEATKYEGYKAQITGEATKASMKHIDTQAYAARVSGAKTGIDANIAAQTLKLQDTKIKTDVFNSYVQKYLADVQTSVSAAEIKAKQQELDTNVFQAESGMHTAQLDAITKVYLGRVEEAKSKAGLSVKESEVAVQTLIQEYQLTADNLKAIAQVAGQMASAAAASVNASLSASTNSSNSANNIASYSESVNVSTTNSYSQVEETIHSYSA